MNNHDKRALKKLTERTWLAFIKAGELANIETITKARQAAELYFWAQYDFWLDKLKAGTITEIKALAEILSLDGYSSSFLTYMLEWYQGADNGPLAAYAADTIGHYKSAGQDTITDYLKELPNTPVLSVKDAFVRVATERALIEPRG